MFTGREKIVKAVKEIDDGIIIELQGSFDMSCSRDLRQQMLDILVEAPQVLIIDMTDVDCMDSSGLAILIEALKMSKRKMCKMRLASLNKRVRGVFEIARLEDLFEIYDTVASASNV